jgi:peptidoglycan/LPS O-acetylase OafA/YrhL
MSAATDATSRGSPRGSDGRDPRLDGLRGLAILLVMLYHTTQYGIARGPVATSLTLVPTVGWSGVDLFFVLSGFLITGILLRARSSSTYYRTFYARRVLRIFPLYYAVLAFFLIVVPHIPVFAYFNDFWNPGVKREGRWFWLYLSNVYVAWQGVWQHQTLDVTWSLAIEEHFYLLWPAVVRHCSERTLLRVCAATMVGALALRIGLTVAGTAPLVPYVLTPCRLDALATGAALALLVRRPGGVAGLVPRARRVGVVATALFAGCYAWARWAGGGGSAGHGYEAETVRMLSFMTRPAMRTVGYTLLCAIYGALLVQVLAAGSRSTWARVFEAGWLRSLGTYSYALYLFHFTVSILMLGFFTPAAHPGHYVPAQLFFWALAIGASYGLARLSWLVLEGPMLSLKRYVPYKV